jgi:hypothetical protein
VTEKLRIRSGSQEGGKVISKTISIQVSEEAARIYQEAPESMKRKLDMLLSLRLMEVSRTDQPLEEIMDEISRNAQRRGLTPEKLEPFFRKALIF